MSMPTTTTDAPVNLVADVAANGTIALSISPTSTAGTSEKRIAEIDFAAQYENATPQALVDAYQTTSDKSKQKVIAEAFYDRYAKTTKGFNKAQSFKERLQIAVSVIEILTLAENNSLGTLKFYNDTFNEKLAKWGKQKKLLTLQVNCEEAFERSKAVSSREDIATLEANIATLEAAINAARVANCPLPQGCPTLEEVQKTLAIIKRYRAAKEAYLATTNDTPEKRAEQREKLADLIDAARAIEQAGGRLPRHDTPLADLQQQLAALKKPEDNSAIINAAIGGTTRSASGNSVNQPQPQPTPSNRRVLYPIGSGVVVAAAMYFGGQSLLTSVSAYTGFAFLATLAAYSATTLAMGGFVVTAALVAMAIKGFGGKASAPKIAFASTLDGTKQQAAVAGSAGSLMFLSAARSTPAVDKPVESLTAAVTPKLQHP